METNPERHQDITHDLQIIKKAELDARFGRIPSMGDVVISADDYKELVAAAVRVGEVASEAMIVQTPINETEIDQISLINQLQDELQDVRERLGLAQEQLSVTAQEKTALVAELSTKTELLEQAQKSQQPTTEAPKKLANPTANSITKAIHDLEHRFDLLKDELSGAAHLSGPPLWANNLKKNRRSTH